MSAHGPRHARPIGRGQEFDVGGQSELGHQGGDLAAVRLIWMLNVKRPDQAVGTVSHEPGLDIFRKQADGSWKIIRYLAYEE